jgi:hypothetical protein
MATASISYGLCRKGKVRAESLSGILGFEPQRAEKCDCLNIHVFASALVTHNIISTTYLTEIFRLLGL